MGQPQQQREPGPGEKGLGFFGRLFLGDLTSDERKAFTKKEQDQLRKRAMLTAGLSMLATAGRPGATFGQALAAGVLRGRLEATQSAGEILDERKAQARAIEYRSVFESADMTELERWQEARRIAAKRGDTEAVKTFNGVLEELRSADEGEAERKFQVVNGTPVWIDEKKGRVYDMDGELIRDLPEERRSEEKRLSTINSLADDFRSEASDAQDVANAVAIGLEAPANAAGDVTLLTMLTRAIDPGVSVREADIRRGEQIGGVTERVQQAINTVASSGEMSPQQREFIRNEIKRVGQTQRRNFLPTIQRYAARAEDANVNPSFVVFDPFEAIDLSGDPFAGPPPGGN